MFLVTDQMKEIPGAVVQLTDASQATTVSVTDSYGQTPWFDVAWEGAAALTVLDAEVAGGTALGFIEELEAPYTWNPSWWEDDADAWIWYIDRSMPVAVDTFVDDHASALGKDTVIYPKNGAYPHWTIVVPKGTGLAFQAGIAPLLDAASVRGYLAYRGQDVAAGAYSRGVVLVLGATLDLPAAGLVVGIDLLGESTSVVVDAYRLHASGLVPGAFAVETLGVDHGIALCRLTGELTQGHVALLVRNVSVGHGPGRSASGPAAGKGSSPQGSVLTFPDNPPEIVVPPGGGGGGGGGDEETGWGEIPELPRDGASAAVAALLAAPIDPRFAFGRLVTQCEPEVPDTGDWECTPLPPESDCPVKKVGETECHETRTRGPKWCRGPGQKVTQQHGVTAAFKVTFSLGGGSSPLTSKGGFEYGHSSQTVQTDEWTAGPGDYNLGQCIRYFRFYMDCAQRWERLLAGWAFGGGELAHLSCIFPEELITLCHDVTDASNTCSQTP